MRSPTTGITAGREKPPRADSGCPRAQGLFWFWTTLLASTSKSIGTLVQPVSEVRTTQMKTFLRVAALAGLVMVAGHARAKAAVTYSYTGINFTNYFGIDSAEQQPRITASVTFASALGNNLSNANLTPEAWQISDGSLTLTNLSPNLTVNTEFIFSTDGSGNITVAGVQVQQTLAQPFNGNPGWNFLSTNASEDQTAICEGTDLSTCLPWGQAYVIYKDTTTTPQPKWTSKVVNPTTTSLTSSANPSTFGQSVTLTATVTPSMATGTVTFNDGTRTLGTDALVNGVATFSTTSLSQGAHSLTTVYSGDANDSASTSSVLTETVNQQAVVIFNNFGANNGLEQGGWVVSGSQNTNLWAGESIQTAASFTPTTNADLSQIDVAVQLSKGTNAFLLTLNDDASGAPGLVLEQWQITDAAPFGDGSPSYGGFEMVNSAGGMLLQSGVSYWLVVSALNSNSNTDGAWRDSPTDIFNGGSGLGIKQQVNGGGWQTLRGYRPAFLVQGTPSTTTPPTPQTITFGPLSNHTLGSGSFALNATASSGLTVTFGSNSTAICTVSGVTVTLVAAGTCSITASQSGNSVYAAATPVTQTFTVTQTVTTTTSLTSSANASIFGQSLTLTATVMPSTATGSVTFRDGSTILNTITLNGGRAALSISSLVTGSHSLTATYGGDTNDASSVSATLTQQINQVVSSIGLTSSLNPSTSGMSVTLTARVSPSTATGTVTFLDGTAKLGTGTLSNGTAALAISSLSVGTHSLTAVYGGDTNDAGSTSSVLTETVNQPTQTVTTTSLTSSANPSIFGQSITLTAKVSPSTATGTVTFNDGTASLGTANLSAGTATLALSTLTAGSQSLTAIYGGDSNDAASTSAVLMQTVNQAVTVQPRVGGLLTCTLSTISGPYGYAISGLLSVSGKLTPFADYGSLVADGNGSFTGFSSESTGGTIASRTLSGSYSINANCSGTATFTDSLGNTLHVAVTVVDNGGEIQFIQTDSGTVVSGTAQRAPTGCDASAVSGPYTYAIGGWIAVAGGFEPFADAGRIVSDGKGNLTGKSTYSASGTIGRRTFTGSYAINSNCTGTATLKDSLGNNDTIAITIVNNGQQVLFIETDSGTVVSGGSQRGQFACSTRTLTGPYSYALEGYTLATNGGIVPGADSGLFTSDGNGHFTGADSISVGGTIVSRRFRLLRPQRRLQRKRGVHGQSRGYGEPRRVRC